MLEARTIYQGDTPSWRVGHDTDGGGTMADLSAGYACNILVVGTAIDRAVTVLESGNQNFIVSLTEAETSDLAKGSYVFSIKIRNASLGFSSEDHGVLTVEVRASANTPEPPNRIDRLRAREEALEDALDEAIGGKPVEVWNGRYGNKVKYEAMSYSEIEAALERVRVQIADETRVAAGGARRGAIGLVWNH